MKTAKELFDELNSWDENRRIEAKSASAVGKSMMETGCAFANEPGLRGGYLIASWILRLLMPVHAWRFISFAILGPRKERARS